MTEGSFKDADKNQPLRRLRIMKIDNFK